jgi:DNA-binding transcriptional ArsR family regulator
LKDSDPASGETPSEPKKSKKNPDKIYHPGPPHDFDPDTELRGRTLRAYLFILKSPKAVGVRELQRSLGLSSPSVAYHHLDKLTRLGLIEKDQYGEYAIIKNANVNVLQAFTQVGRLLVPRFIFYAVFFTTLIAGYVLVFQQSVNFFAIAFGLFASAFAWYEAYRTWKRRPF